MKKFRAFPKKGRLRGGEFDPPKRPLSLSRPRGKYDDLRPLSGDMRGCTLSGLPAVAACTFAIRVDKQNLKADMRARPKRARREGPSDTPELACASLPVFLWKLSAPSAPFAAGETHLENARFHYQRERQCGWPVRWAQPRAGPALTRPVGDLAADPRPYGETWFPDIEAVPALARQKIGYPVARRKIRGGPKHSQGIGFSKSRRDRSGGACTGTKTGPVLAAAVELKERAW